MDLARNLFAERDDQSPFLPSTSTDFFELPPKVTGTLAVDGITRSAEKIKIGVSISATGEARTNSDWEDLVERFEVTQRENHFRLSKNCWFGLGKT